MMKMMVNNGEEKETKRSKYLRLVKNVIFAAIALLLVTVVDTVIMYSLIKLFGGKVTLLFICFAMLLLWFVPISSNLNKSLEKGLLAK